MRGSQVVITAGVPVSLEISISYQQWQVNENVTNNIHCIIISSVTCHIECETSHPPIIFSFDIWLFCYVHITSNKQGCCNGGVAAA
uniref:Uncharacterized protein n=1 Tax=Arion vulgaris TaxID=1028688 RepID=A0A0B6ZLD0_9EUPU